MGLLEQRGFFVGQSASLKQVATEETVNLLAQVSGDYNPVHISQEYAQQTMFGGRIAHGLFCLGMISNLIGTVMPGEGAIFINEVSNYKRPVYIGDEVETTVTIQELFHDRDVIKLEIVCRNQDGKVVLDGSAAVKMV